MNEDAVLQRLDAILEQLAGLRHDLSGFSERRPLPEILTDADIATAVGLRKSHFYKRKKLGDFRMFELTPLPSERGRGDGVRGAPTRYSRALLERWLNGENVSSGAPRRFFHKGR